jgi:hypothetical protein
VRLIAATLDPKQLKPESTWFLATSFPQAQVSAEQVYEIYRLRDWIEHYYKPAKHELGWADDQMRPERAIVRHWQLVMLAYTFSFLVGALPPSQEETADGEKIEGRQRHRVRGAGRLDRHAAPGAGVALPVGSAAAVLETLVEHRPTARASRASRPRRPLSAT